MIEWPVALGVAYLGGIAIGVVLSFTTRRQPLRRNIRIYTVLLAIPIVLVTALYFFLRFAIFREPPTLADLQRSFPSRRSDLETIVRMSDEDSKFSRIAPTFLDREPENPNEFGRFGIGDSKAGLPRPRWDAYRKIYSRNGITLGIQRDRFRNAFIIVDSVGLLNRGHATGYVYCLGPPSGLARFHPCASNQDEESRRYDPTTRREGYSFRKLAERWYAYDEGPS